MVLLKFSQVDFFILTLTFKKQLMTLDWIDHLTGFTTHCTILNTSMESLWSCFWNETYITSIPLLIQEIFIAWWLRKFKERKLICKNKNFFIYISYRFSITSQGKSSLLKSPKRFPKFFHSFSNLKLTW